MAQRGGGSMTRSEGHDQQEAKPFELGLRLVKGLQDVHRFVIDDLVNLLEVA